MPKRTSPTDLLNPKQFKRAVNADTRYQFRPLANQLGKESRASRNRQRTIAKLYRGQVGLDRRLADQSAADSAKQADTYNSFLRTVGATDAANAAQVQADSNKIAQQYGGTPGTGASETAQAAAAARGLSAANYGGYAQRQGTTTRNYLRRQATADKHEGIGERSIERQRLLSINQDKRELAKQRGDFKVKDAADRRAAERDYLIQTKAFGNDKRQTNISAYSARTSRMSENRQRRQDAYDRAHPNSGSSGGKDPYGTTNPRVAAAKLRNHIKSPKDARAVINNPQGTVDYLIDTYSINPAVARKVVNRYIKRHKQKQSSGGWGSFPHDGK